MRLPGFVGPSSSATPRSLRVERTVNLYTEIVTSEGVSKARAALYPVPGLDPFVTLPEVPARGAIEVIGRVFVAAGSSLYEVEANRTVTKRGALPLATREPVQMTHNGRQGHLLVIAHNHTVAYYDLQSNTLYQDVVSAVDRIGEARGYFVGLDDQASILRVSPLLGRSAGTAADPALFAWDAARFERRSLANDPWVSMIVHDGEIILFGKDTTEFWEISDTPDFPFAPVVERTFAIGIAARDSVARVGNTIAWLGGNTQGAGEVYVLDGYSPTRVSTHAVEHAIQGYRKTEGIDRAIGWSYSRDGHVFYVLEFPASQHTWVYDLATAQWHERGSLDARRGDFGVWGARYHVNAFNRALVCDSRSGVISSLDEDRYLDVDDTPIVRLRRAPHLAYENKTIVYHAFELEYERGVGQLVGPAAAVNPTFEMRYSNDGGNHWSMPWSKAMGRAGEYSQRARWMPLGAGRQRVFEVSTSAPVPVYLIDAYLTITPGSH